MFVESFILAICLLFYSHYNKRKHLPPGPISVPFIGSLISKGFKINREEFYKYGDMYSIFLGQSTLIIINDMKRTKELFNRDEFSGKSTLPYFFLNLFFFLQITQLNAAI